MSHMAEGSHQSTGEILAIVQARTHEQVRDLAADFKTIVGQVQNIHLQLVDGKHRMDALSRELEQERMERAKLAALLEQATVRINVLERDKETKAAAKAVLIAQGKKPSDDDSDWRAYPPHEKRSPARDPVTESRRKIDYAGLIRMGILAGAAIGAAVAGYLNGVKS